MDLLYELISAGSSQLQMPLLQLELEVHLPEAVPVLILMDLVHHQEVLY
jgi:hypothetical protein